MSFGFTRGRGRVDTVESESGILEGSEASSRICGEPFVDCNHRTAMLLGRFLAHEFGFNLRYSGPEGERLRKEWENLSRKELEAWVREHLVPLKGS